MAFKLKKVSETTDLVEIGEKLWLKEDGQTIVSDGDPEAAFLFATEGEQMPLDKAAQFGLVKAKGAAANKEAEPEGDKEVVATVKEIQAAVGDMTDEQLEALKADERKGVQAALAAELERRAEAGE